MWLSRLRRKLKRLVAGRRFLFDYTLPPKEDADGHDHIHVCFAARILGEDIKNHCPYYGQNGFELERGLDWEHGGTTCECDRCKYFGIVTSTGEGLRFFLNENVVDTFKE